jgi:hypothetical protein
MIKNFQGIYLGPTAHDGDEGTPLFGRGRNKEFRNDRRYRLSYALFCEVPDDQTLHKANDGANKTTMFAVN